jgi:hypothetical protein
VLELERRARQYMALSDPDLAQLYRRKKIILLDKLMAPQARMPSKSLDIERLNTSLQKLFLLRNDPQLTTNASSIPCRRLDQTFLLVGAQSQTVKTWLLSAYAEGAFTILEHYLSVAQIQPL